MAACMSSLSTWVGYQLTGICFQRLSLFVMSSQVWKRHSSAALLGSETRAGVLQSDQDNFSPQSC
jgi:hypothetical protein